MTQFESPKQEKKGDVWIMYIDLLGPEGRQKDADEGSEGKVGSSNAVDRAMLAKLCIVNLT
jgi:hypothetical protein